MKNNRGSLTMTAFFTMLIFSLYGILLYARSASAYNRQTKSIETIQAIYAQDVPNAARIAEQLGATSSEILEDGEMIVIFNANGGNVDTARKKVTYGETYGDLPVPTRDGYTFVGWHNEKSKNLLNPIAEYAVRYDGTVNRNYIYFDSVSNTYTSYTNNHHHIYGYDVTQYISNGSTYTFSVEIISHGTDANAHIGFDTLDGGIRKVYYKNYTTSIGDRITYTLTIPNGVTRCIVGINNNGDETGVKFAKLQLEEGSVVTEYEPYYIKSSTKVVQQNNHTLTAIWEKN